MDKRYLFFILFLLAGNNLFSQGVPEFRHFGVNDGLPTSEVYQFCIDDKKFLWLCTDRGVVRYDGSDFRVFNTGDSLPENSTIKIYKDYKGRIWFISLTGLLSYFEGERIHPYQYNSKLRKYISNKLITSLFVGLQDELYINTVSDGLITVNASGQITVPFAVQDTSCYLITEPVSRFLHTYYLRGTNQNISAFQIRTSNINFRFSIPDFILSQHFNSLKLKNDCLIFYCERYLIKIFQDHYVIKKFENPVLNVYEDEEQSLWVGCLRDGVHVLDKKLNLKSHYLKGFSVSHVIKDFQNGYWFSTLENGIYYFGINGITTIADKRGKITAVLGLSDSSFFFSDIKGSLYHYSVPEGRLTNINFKKDFQQPIGYINSLTKIGSNDFIVSTGKYFSNSMDKLHFTNWNNLKLHSFVSLVRMIKWKENMLLGADFTSVFSLNTKTNEFKYIDGSGFRSTCLFKDSKGRVFSGSYKGVYLLKDGRFSQVNVNARINNSRITSIAETSDGILVFATRSDGIFLFADTLISTLNESSGLSSNNINCMLAEDKSLWIGSNKGLNRVALQNGIPVQPFTALHYDDGLASEEVHDISSSANYIFLATNEGLTIINKEKIITNLTAYPLYFTSVKVNDTDTALLNLYNLIHTQNTIQIHYGSVNYRNSKGALFKYRLLGLDSIWRSTANRDVQFSSLPAGNYTFQLTGIENGADEIQEIGFYIKPPFYQTYGFRFFIITTALLLVFVVIKLWVKYIRKKEKAKEVLNRTLGELNLKALRSQMNPHFTFNVLNSIQYYVANNDGDRALEYIGKFSRLIRIILDQSNNMYISLEEEINLLNLYLELEKLRFTDKIHFSIQSPDDSNKEIFIPGMLIQPFVENAVKHGAEHKSGLTNINITFSRFQNMLLCSIQDNGIGRAAASNKVQRDMHASIATNNVKERIEAIRFVTNSTPSFKIKDLLNTEGVSMGTEVILEIPYQTHQND